MDKEIAELILGNQSILLTAVGFLMPDQHAEIGKNCLKAAIVTEGVIAAMNGNTVVLGKMQQAATELKKVN